MGIFEGIYRVVMRRNAVYVTFVVAGALVGERVVDYGVHKIWGIQQCWETIRRHSSFGTTTS